ncbi:hypothetical protein T492DRAFT_850306 [Pavlovales sp. CCMP2436]|nr:hypothetical protein T492DRAFT_850306 [Pavlovales sp. CCMP2436]
MPYSAPGKSFDLVGYLVVSPTLVRTRETRVLSMANKENGWEAPPHDKEWRRWLGASDGVYNAVAKLLTDLGIWYIFERGTGKIMKQGGSHVTLDQASIFPLVRNVLTRSLWRQNVRQVGKVQVTIGRGVEDALHREKHLMAPQDFGAKILRRDLPAFLRASYAPLYTAGMEMSKLGYSMDLKLSSNEAKVFFSAATGAVVCFRGSVNAADWAENLQLGVGIFGPRHQRSKVLMEKVQAKYGPSHAIGHSLGGHLAEHSGARGLILTVDKAVGARDLGTQSNPNELDIRAKGDVVSALSHGGQREEVVPTGKPAAAPRFLPGPIRAPIGMIIRGTFAHNYGISK